jgi:tetratricopeptide (TPR) repeat protein
MKNLLLGLILISATLFAQNPKYIKAMEKGKSMIDTAHHVSSLQEVANIFQRIAGAEKKEWLPPYYLSYAYTMIGFFEKDKDKKDGYYDKATAYIETADSLSPENSEIYTLKGMLLQMQLQVNPMMRGQKYGTLAATNLEKAIKLNPENPRPYYIRGQSLFYTPPMFGGGKDKAKPYLQTAVEKYTTFKPENSIMPTWGVERAKMLLEECNK